MMSTMHFFVNIAVTFALCLVQEETVKMGFCLRSVRKGQVSQNNEETAECGEGSAAGRSWGSPDLRQRLHLNINSYI